MMVMELAGLRSDSQALKFQGKALWHCRISCWLGYLHPVLQCQFKQLCFYQSIFLPVHPESEQIMAQVLGILLPIC